MRKVEYKVRPVTRYIVTMYVTESVPAGSRGASCAQLGEYLNGATADLMADALVALDKSQGHESIRVREGMSLGEVISGKRCE